MAILTVTMTTNYIGMDLTDTTQIVFDTSGFAEATFAASQFGGGQISESVEIIGDDTNNSQISVQGISGAFSIAGWTFSGMPVLVFMLAFDGDDTITGNSQTMNGFRGGAGADTLIGGASGNVFFYGDPLDLELGETVVGGAGLDRLEVAAAGGNFNFSVASLTNIDRINIVPWFDEAHTTVTITGAQIAAGIDRVANQSSASVTLNVIGAMVDLSSLNFGDWNPTTDKVTINGTAGNDSLIGSIQDDTLNGLAGNDMLDGGAGADIMNGGPGNDTYIVDNVGDTVNEAAGQGIDLVRASISYVLGANVENLTLTGSGAINGTGNGGANTITGNSGNNELFGLGGSDALYGGTGNDTLNGGAGNDILDGGAGADTMVGGTGDDTYFVDNVGDKVIEAAGEGIDHVVASVAFKLGPNIEKLTLIGTSAVDATGDSGDNVIVGNDGANRINGGPGKDTLTGKLGADTFVFDAAVKPKKTAKANADLITDFTPKVDTIELAKSVFKKLKLGDLSKQDFGKGKKKPAKDDHLVYYNKKTGDLWYDANGKKKGGKGDVLVATLDKGLKLSADDIVVA